MRTILKVLIFLSVLPGTAMCQEKVTKMMAGPRGDQFRIVVALIAVTDTSMNTKSLIVDVNQVKKKSEQPTSFYVDLTATQRSLGTGDKKQKILVIRWEKSGDVEVKCEGGKFVKETTGPELDKIMEMVKAVVQSAPLETRGDAVEFTIPKDLEQKLISILDGLDTSTLKCVRDGS